MNAKHRPSAGSSEKSEDASVTAVESFDYSRISAGDLQEGRVPSTSPPDSPEPLTIAGPGLRRLLWWLGFATAGVFLSLASKYLDDLTRQRPGTLFTRAVEETTGVYAAVALMPQIILLAARYRLDRKPWLASLPVHILGMAVFSAAHTSLNWASRALLFQALGHGRYDYGLIPIRYLMEAPVDVILYTVTVAFVYLFDHYRRARDREVTTAQLEARLAEARLQALAMQLQPHFLFNTLNMISEMVYANPEAADQMIARLSELLRLTLRESGRQVAPLSRELVVLELYVDIMKGRFQEKLAITLDVGPGAPEALVPPLILQTIVENSIRHGIDPLTGEVRIGIRCAVDGGCLTLEVRDDGPGLAGSYLASESSGIGLANTVRRLEQLYGDAQQFSMEPSNTGGLLVRMKIPYRAEKASRIDVDDKHSSPDSGRRAAGAAKDPAVSRAGA